MRAAWTTSILFALLIGQGSAFADSLSWLASYPYYGQPASSKLVAAGLAPGTLEQVTATQPSQPSGDSAVTSSQPLGARSAITESHSIGAQNGQAQMPAWWNEPLQSQEQQPNPGLVPYHAVSAPWYDTPLGVLGIGVAATGTTMLFDHGINNYVENHVSIGFRNHVALNIADVITDGSLIIAGTTWFQSPWASAKLAHTSSVALTAAVATTLEVFALKYAVGRARPGGPNTSSTQYHPFSSRYAIFSTSFLFNNRGPATASFPSGHTAIAFAVITPYAQNYHLPWLYALPMLVGVSRIVAVDGHWASDVVAGGFLGWLTADLTNRLFPNSDYGFMIFGDGVGFHGKF